MSDETLTAEQIAAAIAAKSDQLNADDLISGPITVRVLAVREGTKDQPWILKLDGGRMPFKPCKTVRRLIVAAWGNEAKDWVGRCMTLYRDDKVEFGGAVVGGVRVSHMSHLAKPLNIMLSVKKGKKGANVIEPLRTLEDVLQAQGTTWEEVDAWCATNKKPPLSKDSADVQQRAAAYFARNPIKKAAAPAAGEPAKESA